MTLHALVVSVLPSDYKIQILILRRCCVFCKFFTLPYILEQNNRSQVAPVCSAVDGCPSNRLALHLGETFACPLSQWDGIAWKLQQCEKAHCDQQCVTT